MKKKILFGLGALVIVLVLLMNVSLVGNSQKSDISLNSMVNLAKADDECPVDPIPWHCAWSVTYEPCYFTNLCILTCLGGCY